MSLIHATCVAIGNRGVLLAGASGRGKSDLALCLIDRGARLVSDDYSEVRQEDGRLIASAPTSIAGKIECRGVGIISMEALPSAPICLVVDLDGEVERLPERRMRLLEELAIPSISLSALEASAPIKVEAALTLYGLPYS